MSTSQILPTMSNRVSVDPETGTLTAIRKLRESGNSIVLTIPPQLLEGAGLEAGDSVKLIADMNEDTITIRDVTED